MMIDWLVSTIIAAPFAVLFVMALNYVDKNFIHNMV